MVGSFAIFFYFRAKGCKEIVNDTWLSDSPVLQLPSSQCGISLGGACAIAAVLLNFACFVAMYVLDSNYQRMLIDEVLEINHANLKATEDELEMVLMRKRLRNSHWEIGEDKEIDVSYVDNNVEPMSMFPRPANFLRPPTGTQTASGSLLASENNSRSDKFSVHPAHGPEGGGEGWSSSTAPT